MKVLFQKQIHGDFGSASWRDVWLEAEVDLPFAPMPGMWIRDGKSLDEQLKEVYWDLDNNRFIAYTQDDKELYDYDPRGERPHREVMVIANEYLAGGFWKLEKPREDKK